MSDKKGYSEKDESFFGEEYEQHYDEDYNKDGWSGKDENFWGEEYIQHHEQDGSRSGTSEVKETLWGDKYVQRYDEEGNESGYSEKKRDFWGNEYTQHYDEEGNEVGKTEEKKDFFGNEYKEHDLKKGKPKNESEEGEAGWFTILLGLAVIALALYAIATVIATTPLWGGMLMVSSVSTYVFAEALKSESDWALSIRQEHESWSIWFGPITALGFAVLALLGMVIAGFSFTILNFIVLLIVIGAAVWLCRRTATPIMRWRLARLVENQKTS